MKNVLITGGAGFIGSHLVKFFVKKYPNYNIINLDNLTYAGDLNNLNEIPLIKETEMLFIPLHAVSHPTRNEIAATYDDKIYGNRLLSYLKIQSIYTF